MGAGLKLARAAALTTQQPCTPPRGAEITFLQALVDMRGKATPRVLGLQMSQDDNRARQLCSRRGWAYYDGRKWHLTEEGRFALSRAEPGGIKG